MSGLMARCTGRSYDSPGPGSYNTRSSLGGPAYTLKGRHETSSRPITAPYRDLPSTVGQGPKISLASRHSSRNAEDTPGPGYVPPALGSDAKKISMSYRHSQVRDSRYDNPGPGAYSIAPKFANDAQKSTLHGRTKMNDAGSASPGPAAYNPDINATKRRAPSATMHVRPKESTSEITPGPADYNVSHGLGGTKPTMHGRPKESTSEITPGPGAYSPQTSNTGPRYTMKGRHDMASRPITAPYRSLPTTVGQGPKISLASRHSTRNAEDTPGPAYVPPALGSDAKKISMSYRHSETRDSRYDNPGPGAYSIAPKFANDAPKSTLHGRTKMNDGGSASPGPGAYMPNIDSVKPRAPSATMHVRTKLNGPEATPGYYDIGSTLRGPKYTIGRRENLDLIPV